MQLSYPSTAGAKLRAGKSLREAAGGVDGGRVYIGCMSAGQFMTTSQRALLQGVSRLGYANPFLPERVECERAVLGDEFMEGEPVWSYRAEHPEPRANVWRIVAKLEPVVEQLGARLRAGVAAREQDLGLYEDAALQLLYQRCYPKFYEAGFGGERSNPARWRFYNEFLADWRRCFAIEGVSFSERDPRHTFACFRQIQRAFDITFRDIIGSSLPAARLRGAVWQSIFTHDMRRYRRTLYARMGEFATLITGPSGTGKELVARAIAESRYVPFDDQRLAFADDGETAVLADQHFGAVADAGGVGAIRASARRVYGRGGGSARVGWRRVPSWGRCFWTSSAIWIRRSR